MGYGPYYSPGNRLFFLQHNPYNSNGLVHQQNRQNPPLPLLERWIMNPLRENPWSLLWATNDATSSGRSNLFPFPFRTMVSWIAWYVNGLCLCLSLILLWTNLIFTSHYWEKRKDWKERMMFSSFLMVRMLIRMLGKMRLGNDREIQLWFRGS